MSAARLRACRRASRRGEPPEARGLRPRRRAAAGRPTRRDGRIAHARFRDLPASWPPGDLLVVNTSATLPAAIAARRAGRRRRAPAPPRDPAPRSGRRRLVGGRAALARRRPARRSRGAGELLALAGGGAVELVAPYARRRAALARPGRGRGARCSTTSPATAGRSATATSRATGRWPPTRPCSRPSPGAPRCRAPGARSRPSSSPGWSPAGVGIAPALAAHRRLLARAPRGALPRALPGAGRPPRRWSTHPRARGGRVVAVGTTVVRALETVAAPDGRSRRAGWTDLVITPERGPAGGRRR